MKNFIVYDDSGNILRTGSCPDSMVSMQGENVVEGIADDATQKIVDGKVVAKLPEEIEPSSLETPEEEMPAIITKKQWKKVLDRLDKAEEKSE